MELYVDSGAAYTVLHASIAEGIGFDYRKGQLIHLQVGDGGFIPVYLHSLEFQLGPERFTAQVGFSERLGVSFNLMGRADIFERFEICFHEKQRIVSFERAL
ncbi:MAG: retropepsin-like domain-containing protein [Candidatus Bipolaricaulota bacterium]|nr:retropepsin-like domain-containing protein [Candidatus Bipolaricaulota bacterium]MCS7274594.1 retropepsin-like domain-containing protein [Candidatus Bipolaricaulota bacterium]MDW8110975.1 retropepsin-like aspartic protease [Candidatus Bipolaricaulota bacterium]MDW8329024.1 retropepsin-like aspartic protease [Candidatus Bipolaricaulota bacterium]